MSPLLALALACAPDLPEEGAPPPVEVRAWLDGAAGAAGGALVVQVETADGVAVDLPDPEAEGLLLREEGEARTERLGDRTVVTRRWRYQGEPGSYVIPGPAARWTDAEGQAREERAERLFVDLGVAPPRPGDMLDIVEPPRVWAVPWRALGLTGAGVGALALGALAAARWLRKPPPPPPPPDPPDVVALRAWEAARRDPALDDHGRAIAISRIFRVYLEAALRFPAESWTTGEILDHLGGMAFLPEGNVPRAKRLLRATDLVKYAERGATAELFVDLDADLRAFLESTRPKTWSPP